MMQTHQHNRKTSNQNKILRMSSVNFVNGAKKKNSLLAKRETQGATNI